MKLVSLVPAGAPGAFKAAKGGVGGARPAARRLGAGHRPFQRQSAGGRVGLRLRLRARGVHGRGGAHPRVHPRRRRDAGGALAAHVHPFRECADQPLPRLAQPQSIAVHVLHEPRRLPHRQLVAGDSGAGGTGRRTGWRRAGNRKPAPAASSSTARWRETRRRGRTEAEDRGDGGGAGQRSQGDRGASDAHRPGPQRRRPGGEDRQREGHRAVRRRALLARDAPFLERRRRTRRRQDRDGRAPRHAAGGNALRRPRRSAPWRSSTSWSR